MKTDFERTIYLDGLHGLAQSAALGAAIALLSDWSFMAKGQNLAAAACYYLTHNVMPMLQTGTSPKDAIPGWVDRILFHPPLAEVRTVDEWLSLFPGTECEAIDDRDHYYDERGNDVEVGIGCEAPQGATRAFRGKYGINIPLEVIEMLKSKNRGLYFSPNGHTGQRNIPNTDRLNACFADFDEGTKGEQIKKIESLPLAPSAIVESGHGFHVYWLFRLPETDKELWRRVQTKIIEVCGSDKAIKNPDRLMRLPFSWHTKEEPVLVRLRAYSPIRYTLADVEVAFPPTPVKKYDGGAVDNVRGLRIPKPTSLGAGVRHSTLEEECARMYARLAKEKALAARSSLKIWYQASCSPLKGSWEKEVDDMCDWCERKEYGSVVSR